MAIPCKALQAVWEAEELKGQLLKAENELQDVRAALGAEENTRAEAERQLQQVRQQNDSLQVRLQHVAFFPHELPKLQGARAITSRSQLQYLA